ncbi:MAG: hypothetical protein QM733_08080 [Ilumatobacteraceae bacterium]
MAERRRQWRWLALTAVMGLVAAVAAVATSAGVARAAVQNSFSPPVFTTQDNGAIVLTGNSQMSCPTSASGCAAAQIAGPTATGNINNNSFTMSFLDLDGLSTTTNSTSADLNLPSGSVVLYAMLLWGGRTVAGSGGVAAGSNPNRIKFRTPASGTTYTTLTATSFVNPLPDTSSNYGPYQGSIDVTSQVAAAGNGTYWAADIQAATGLDRYAGWSLVVAYRNPAQPLRDLSIFEGFANVTTQSGDTRVDIPVSGFLTPATGVVNASVGFVAWEGDRSLTGETVTLNGATLSDATRPANNFFASGITDAGTNITARNASNANNFGVDIARVVANGILPNNATSTTLSMTTNSDYYYPGLVTTQIDLYTPAFNPVSKTVTNLSGHSPAQVGDTLRYQVTFTNTGADYADQTVVTDVLAANQTYVPGSISVITSPGSVNNGDKTDATGDDIAEYVAASRTVRVRVGTGATATAGGVLAPGDTVTFRFNATLDRASAGTTVDNNASLAYRARTIAKDFAFIGNVVSTPVAALADLAVTKSSSPASVVAGETVQYPITVTNNGPSAAADVVVVDTLPAGLSYQSVGAPTGASCTNSGQVVTCTAATLANGASLTFTVTATVPAGSLATSVVNSVRVSSSTSDDVAGNDTASATTTITRSADIVATKTGPAGTTNAGAQITYMIAATNDGPSTATTVRLTDVVPAGTNWISVTPTAGSASGSTCALEGGTEIDGSWVGGTVACTVASLDPGAKIEAVVVLRVGSGFGDSSLTNVASATSAVTDPNTANNSATVSSPIAQSADVAIVKAFSPTAATAGSTVTYTLTVTDAGPSDAQSVTVADPVVAGLTATTVASTRGTCTITAGALSCALGTLGGGSQAVITVQGTVASTYASATLANTATVATATPDPVAENNSSTATLNVTRSADVSIVKTGPATIPANTDQTYTLTIANAGPSQADGVTATDTLPADLSFVAGPNCSATGQVVTCAVGPLASGASVTRPFVVHAAANVSSTVTNTASVTSTTDDPVTTNNTSTFASSGRTRPTCR